ncbi:MAG: carbohydrate-binding domain-containing protein [Candidatus Bipolaricaulis anaerobius]
MHRSKWTVGVIALALAAAVAGGVTQRGREGADQAAADASGGAAILALGGGFTAALAAAPTSPTVTEIVLAGSAIQVTGTGAVAQGSRLLITAGGTYHIRGTLDDGQVVVSSADNSPVNLVLGGARITCSTSSPIYIAQAKDVVISLAAGTDNTLTDGSSYLYEVAGADEPNAALFSADDLVITGTGSLTVNGNYSNGIQSKDDLALSGATVTVAAVNDGIKGRDSITVSEATITIRAGADGMQSNNDEDPERGTVTIESGTIRITSGEDGIQAETRLVVHGGTIEVLSGGGSANNVGQNPVGGMGFPGRPPSTATSLPSMKGLKAGVDLMITGGTILVDSADDALHSNGTITIDGGTLTLASGDDAIHADEAVTVNGGQIQVKTSYEGVEGNTITVNSGEVRITSTDDGINATSGGAAAMPLGRPGMASSSSTCLFVNGGWIVINSGGDGLDVNSSIAMTGGTVLINGPTRSDNGALDYYGTFKITGGLLVAAGSAGMAQAPSTSSTVNSVLMTFTTPQPAGTLFHIAAAGGGDVLTFAPAKAYQSVVVASPLLTNGSTYAIYLGGRSAGAATDGLSAGGDYTPGTEVARFTVAGNVTYAGASRIRPPGW